LLCYPIRLIVEWKSFGRLHCFRRPNSRAENLSTPLNESLESGKSLEPSFTQDDDSKALLPSFKIDTRVSKRMSESEVKSKRTFEIPCRESLLETKASNACPQSKHKRTSKLG
jgi:hypothetical protein